MNQSTYYNPLADHSKRERVEQTLKMQIVIKEQFQNQLQYIRENHYKHDMMCPIPGYKEMTVREFRKAAKKAIQEIQEHIEQLKTELS